MWTRHGWPAEGRSAATLAEFFEELGEEKATIQAVSIDMSAGYEKAIGEAVPHAEVCCLFADLAALAEEEADDLDPPQG